LRVKVKVTQEGERTVTSACDARLEAFVLSAKFNFIYDVIKRDNRRRALCKLGSLMASYCPPTRLIRKHVSRSLKISFLLTALARRKAKVSRGGEQSALISLLEPIPTRPENSSYVAAAAAYAINTANCTPKTIKGTRSRKASVLEEKFQFACSQVVMVARALSNMRAERK
jgi:hypothetical protein